MSDINLSLFTRLAWDLEKYPMAKQLELARENGFEGVSFLCLDFLPFLRSPERLVQKLEKHHLSLTHIALADMPPLLDSQEIDRVEDLARALGDIGVPFLATLHCGPMGPPITADNLNRMGEMCKKHAVQLTYHPHGEPADLNRKLFATTDPELVKFHADTSHLLQGGLDPAGFIREMGDRTVLIDFKDYRKSDDSHQALGEADVDFPGVWQVMQEIDYSGWVALELNYRNDRDTVENLKVSREYIRKLCGV